MNAVAVASARSLKRQFALLENSGLIQLAGGQSDLFYLFRHGLIQHAAYATLLRRQLQQWHQVVGQVLEDAKLGGPDEAQRANALAPVLARHFSIAGEDERALRYFIRAGDAAYADYALSEATEYYAQAIAVTRRMSSIDYDSPVWQHVYGRPGRALELRGLCEAGLASYAAMQQIRRDRGNRALELAGILARAAIYSTVNYSFDSEQSRRLLELASPPAQALGDHATQARVYWNLMLLNTMRGEAFDERRRYGELSVAVAREHGLDDQLASTLLDMWFAYAGAGDWADARHALQEAANVARQCENMSVRREASGRLSIVELVQGNYDAALRYASEAVRLSQVDHSPDLEGLSLAFVGLIHNDRGEFDTALTTMQAAVALGESAANLTVLVGTRSELGHCYAELGASERGLPLAHAAHAPAIERFKLIDRWAVSNLVRILLKAGHISGAIVASVDQPPFRDVHRRPDLMAVMWLNFGLATDELALAQGDPAAAATVLSDLLDDMRSGGVLLWRTDALAALACAHLALGRLAQARAGLMAAIVEAQVQGSRRMLWQILANLAEVDLRSRRLEAAASLRRRARQVVEQLTERVPTAALRASFTSRLDVQRVLDTDKRHQSQPAGVAIARKDTMNSLAVLPEGITWSHNLVESVMADVTPDQARWAPPGVARVVTRSQDRSGHPARLRPVRLCVRLRLSRRPERCRPGARGRPIRCRIGPASSSLDAQCVGGRPSQQHGGRARVPEGSAGPAWLSVLTQNQTRPRASAPIRYPGQGARVTLACP